MSNQSKNIAEHNIEEIMEQVNFNPSTNSFVIIKNKGENPQFEDWEKIQLEITLSQAIDNGYDIEYVYSSEPGEQIISSLQSIKKAHQCTPNIIVSYINNQGELKSIYDKQLINPTPQDIINIRCKNMSEASDFNDIRDVLIAEYQCPKCNKKDKTITFIMDEKLHKITNNFPQFITLLCDKPEMWVDKEIPCNCKWIFKIKQVHTRTIFCRTNPKQQNDLHLIVRYDDQEPQYDIALLDKDGSYYVLSKDEIKEKIGI